jgi:hypothetical protein
MYMNGRVIYVYYMLYFIRNRGGSRISDHFAVRYSAFTANIM